MDIRYQKLNIILQKPGRWFQNPIMKLNSSKRTYWQEDTSQRLSHKTDSQQYVQESDSMQYTYNKYNL